MPEDVENRLTEATYKRRLKEELAQMIARAKAEIADRQRKPDQPKPPSAYLRPRQDSAAVSAK